MKFGKFSDFIPVYFTKLTLYRLWETGWKERYYRTKFHLNLEEKDEIRE